MPEIIPSLIIAGDMNYSFDTTTYHHTHRAGKPKQFADFLNTHFSDCLNPKNEPHAYTFRRGSTMSTIDYMFAGHDIASKMSDATNSFIRPDWTDHALLTKTYTTGLTNCGKGLWRANPHLAKNHKYRQKLDDELRTFVAVKLDSSLSAQEKWDLIKNKAKQVTIQFTRTHDHWRKARIKTLQSERNNLIRRYRHDTTCLRLLLQDVENELAKLQQEIVDIQLLKAGKRWLENSEKSPGYIKQTSKQRLDQRTIPNLKHPRTGVDCLDTASKLNAAERFYQKLYTEERIDSTCLNKMLDYIDTTLSADDANQITALIDYDDILLGSARTPKESSPGLDGIGYEILYLIISHPSCRDIVHQVFNDAIQHAKFPKSWQESCIILLFKKGDRSDLANYRPITLIAADCKVFTRIMNSRVIPVANKLINPYQCGFLSGRYIGDHGMSLRVIMDNASSASWRNATNFVEYTGIMLDNAKAYDRVHPQYLSQVLLKFGFPPQFVACILNLFFDNFIHVNINGFLTKPIAQRRGIRQGDSISPVLFNLAIEPFLLSIINNTAISGYSLQHTKLPKNVQIPWVSPAPVKVLAYADDVLTYVKSHSELTELQRRLKTYNRASNAKINYDKSVAFPLHGGSMKGSEGLRVQDHIINRLKMKWYDSHSPGYIKYLGYPIWFSNHQRDVYVSELLGKVKAAVAIYSQRNVSLYGKANIANNMILSKLWHVIRIVSLPLDVLKQLKSIIYQFVMSGLFPPLKGNSFFLPRDQGGLGLIDIGAQQHALQFRYIKVLLQGNKGSVPDFTYQLLTNALRLAHDTPDHVVPLFFKAARYKNTLNGFHPFHSIFGAMDICRQRSSLCIDWQRRPSALTILSLPLTAIFTFDENLEELEFLQCETAKTSKVQEFFKYNSEQAMFQLVPKSTCSKRNTWLKLEKALLRQELHYQPFVHNNSTEDGIDLRPFAASLRFQQLSILQLSNKNVRFIMQSLDTLDVGRHFNNNISKKQWTAFYKNDMHYSARNLWYRMLHQQSPNKLALFQRHLPNLESDHCDLCNEVEDAKHLLISCAHKIDVWNSTFNEFLSYPKNADPRLVYNNIMLLKLERYLIYSYDMQFTIYDFFATIMRMIWRNHFQQLYNYIPFDPSVVCRQIRAELIRLSNLRKL
ncbi:uncharacterized protein ATC70_002448 [Mucor velutinosus]|uniref:Reverse transcriptase domain-containing protein n=1 Tax=Mucor velutinosus TaxID=708070 RepID=A0AAN7DDI6_9FUNG|nr:hypothetical protein ATC70_002448 [Mucor velutinosus]